MSDLISRQAVLNFTTTVTASEDAHKVLESFLGEFVAYVESLPSEQPEDKCGECDAWNQYKNYTRQPEQRWIPVSERLPEENVPVNITWVNHNPPEYYGNIKDMPFTATGVYFHGTWYWYSVDIEDVLAEYGISDYITESLKELIDNDIEITAWMPLPAPFDGGKR